MAIEREFWIGRRVLVTGHTGFKGAWLSLWLQHLGARVSGLAAGAPSAPSLFELADVGGHMQQHAADIRDARLVEECVRAANPEVLFHLAAEPIVRRSLAAPVQAYEINVMGTVNVLDAARRVGDELRAVVVVTSDKCYENDGRAGRRFSEEDALGGADPYSSSKACAELAASAYRRSYFAGERIATARAGNVIGGGDWGEDRLLADAARAIEAGTPLLVRNPAAVRPWQHVLNPLSGYLLLAQRLCERAGTARAWNFGPAAEDERPVSWILDRLAELWDGELRWQRDGREHPAEAQYLALSSAAAERELHWRTVWPLDEALRSIVSWHRARDARAVSLAQIEEFAAASSANVE